MPDPDDSAAQDLSINDTLLRIEINPPLPCGIGGCGAPSRSARVERDPRLGLLWNLLPICEAHQVSLAARAMMLADATNGDRSPGR
ncbi:MAG TPA: hypothetical protein VFQ25_11500 [Ktedonobacterales bacterium]|nr:hypothetical protein [Ktedonobacterales bacterium]